MLDIFKSGGSFFFFFFLLARSACFCCLWFCTLQNCFCFLCVCVFFRCTCGGCFKLQCVPSCGDHRNIRISSSRIITIIESSSISFISIRFLQSSITRLLSCSWYVCIWLYVYILRASFSDRTGPFFSPSSFIQVIVIQTTHTYHRPRSSILCRENIQVYYCQDIHRWVYLIGTVFHHQCQQHHQSRILVLFR